MTSPIEERLKRIEERLKRLERLVLRDERIPASVSATASMNVSELLSLPDSLRKTMMAIQDLKEAPAREVAEKSGRTRSVETIYLNQLVRMGLLTRERKGRKIYFKPIRYY